MRKGLKYLFYFVIILFVSGYLVFFVKKSSEASQRVVCSNMQITINETKENQLLSENEIIQLLNNEQISPIGKSVVRIKTDKLEKCIKQHPIVSSVECYKSPNGDVLIDIKQRKPVFRVVGSENYYVDNKREIMPLSTSGTAYVPIVTGRVTKKMAVSSLYDFVDFINKSDFWTNQIEQINISDQFKLELIPRVGDHIILLGKSDNYKKKMDKLMKFYQLGLNEVGWNIYSIIDVQYKNQIVCTKKERVL